MLMVRWGWTRRRFVITVPCDWGQRDAAFQLFWFLLQSKTMVNESLFATERERERERGLFATERERKRLVRNRERERGLLSARFWMIIQRRVITYRSTDPMTCKLTCQSRARVETFNGMQTKCNPNAIQMQTKCNPNATQMQCDSRRWPGRRDSLLSLSFNLIFSFPSSYSSHSVVSADTYDDTLADQSSWRRKNGGNTWRWKLVLLDFTCRSLLTASSSEESERGGRSVQCSHLPGFFGSRIIFQSFSKLVTLTVIN